MIKINEKRTYVFFEALIHPSTGNSNVPQTLYNTILTIPDSEVSA